MLERFYSEDGLTNAESQMRAAVMNGIQVDPVDLAELDHEAIEPLVVELRSKHHLDGIASVASTPILLFQLQHSAAIERLRPSAIRILPYGWEGQFGGILTITAFITFAVDRSPVKARVCIPPDQRAFESLKPGRITALFLHHRQVVFGYSVNFAASTASKQWYDEQWSRVAGHSPFLPDPEASYWEILNCLANTFDDSLTASDRLSLGWAHSYSQAVRGLQVVLNAMSLTWSFPELHVSDLPSPVVSLLESIQKSHFQAKPALDHVRQVHEAGDLSLLELMQGESAFQSFVHERTGHAHCQLLTSLFDVYLRSPSLTRCGRALPWADIADGFAIRQVELKPKEFPPEFDRSSYWERIPFGLLPNWGHLVHGNDVPIGGSELRSASETLQLADNPPEVDSSANALLDEAIAHKRGTIPRSAIIELSFGPFVHMQVSELNLDVCFVCRTSNAEFCIISVEPDNKVCLFPAHHLVDLGQEKRSRLEAGIKLLLSAVIRDFWVVEDRHSVFAHRISTDRIPGERTEPTGPRVIYLPRIRYSERPNLDRCTNELSHLERRAHFVRAHSRRAEHPSEHQLFLAHRYGYPIQPGYTFVRARERGKNEQAVIYRSRSALQSLFTVVSIPSENQAPSRWFKFERDVYRLMAALGFKVEHIAASRRGDHGIDVFATKGTDLEAISWVIQCKCYSRRKVGPDTVRELIGVLQLNRDNYPAGTRGMIVTTSTFTLDANAEADQAGIRLIDGKEFLRFVNGADLWL